MELGALLVARKDLQTTPTCWDWSAVWPVLGKTVLERSLERLCNSGAGVVSVATCGPDESAHVRTMRNWARAGVEKILLITLGSYAEIDLIDLIHFHHHGRNQVTQVFDNQGPLGVSLLDRKAVLMQKSMSPLYDKQTPARYDFCGYAARLLSTVAYHQLVQDALQGRCEIRPAGCETDEGVWIDSSAEIHASVKIHGPCYIGANTRLRAGVTIRDYSSVERGCEIDIGTTLDHACILPHTYLASGLLVRNSIVDGTRLEHLTEGVTVDLGQAGLSARNARSEFHEVNASPAHLSGTRRVCVGTREGSVRRQHSPARERSIDAV